MSTIDHPIMLLILDGWGHSDDPRHNAIHSAKKPTWDRIWNSFPNLLIHCSGSDVGLPDAQMGNSEVGHMHLGAGRTVKQDYTRISKSVADGSFFDNATLKTGLARVAANGQSFHVFGLLSPGGVHSHENHIVAALHLAAERGVKRTYIHAFLDGRDTPPRSASPSIALLQQKCDETGVGEIASIIGRYYAMDRNGNWDRIQAAYDLIVEGHATYQAGDAQAALDDAYARGENDEFVSATAIVRDGSPPIRIEDGDLVFFANFRADRARQLTAAFGDDDFDGFSRRHVAKLDGFITMTSYGEHFDLPTAFAPSELHNTYGEWVAAHDLRQLRIAETEKYAHVTFFFNGGSEQARIGEDRVLIPSPDVATYDLKPEMSAAEVTDALVEAITRRTYDTIVCNYANADMVGHTGDFDAAVQCIEFLDSCLQRVVAAAQENAMEILITADHGNAEQMRTIETDQTHTAHTNNLVPLIYIGRPATMAARGCLSDIAPTMLSLMGIEIPPEMTGTSLVSLSNP